MGGNVSVLRVRATLVVCLQEMHVRMADGSCSQGLSVVVMGVCGSGKTTVGRELATLLGATFTEGDDFHPAANVHKMQSGTPLNDDDRWPWLDAIGAHISKQSLHGVSVASCSALKEAYRSRLAAAMPSGSRLVFVHLHLDQADITARMKARSGHFMPAALVASQFDALEDPVLDKQVRLLGSAPSATVSGGHGDSVAGAGAGAGAGGGGSGVSGRDGGSHVTYELIQVSSEDATRLSAAQLAATLRSRLQADACAAESADSTALSPSTALAAHDE